VPYHPFQLLLPRHTVQRHLNGLLQVHRKTERAETINTDRTLLGTEMLESFAFRFTCITSIFLCTTLVEYYTLLLRSR